MDSPVTAPLTVRAVRRGTTVTIHVTGEIDLATTALLERTARKVFESDALVIILDLSAVEFIDSAGISLLLRLSAESRRNGDRLNIARCSPFVRRLLDLTDARRALA